MNRQLFPEEFINSSIEHYSFHLNRYSLSIYRIIGLILIGVLLSLPIIHVDIQTRSKGIVTTGQKNKEIRSSVTAPVLFSMIRENQPVHPGDTLVQLDDRKLQLEINRIHTEIKILQQHRQDLTTLVTSTFTEMPSLSSITYQLAYQAFQTELAGIQIRLRKEHQDYLRQSSLHHEKVISDREYEEAEMAYNQQQNAYQNLVDAYRAQWEVELYQTDKEIERLRQRHAQLIFEKKSYVILSQTAGFLINTEPLTTGDFTQPGQVICHVSTDSSLIVSCLVGPQDIGLLRIHQKVRFAIDAYDFHDWGFLEGEVYEISKDAYIRDRQPLFEVKCRIRDQQLYLANGFEGNLKKGMTVTANFLVTRRTLLQLLFDKADDWLNPNHIES